MRIVFLFLLVVIGFGFLLSDRIHIGNDLDVARDQLAGTKEILSQREIENEALKLENERLVAQINALTSENQGLRAQINTLVNERVVLLSQQKAAQSNFSLVAQENLLLEWFTSTPWRPLVAALLFLPVLPLSVGAAYIVTRRKATIPSPEQSNGLIDFSLEEYRLIVQRRKILDETCRPMYRISR